jgi:hypothetical protein
MSGSTIIVDSQAASNPAIEQVDQAGTGAFNIVLSSDITEGGTAGQPARIYALDLVKTVAVTIHGAEHSLNGAGKDGGLAVIGCKVTIESLTIEDTVAQGGTGTKSGGGGAGLGGGLFVGPLANVALSDVSFGTNAAQGGDSGRPGLGGGAGGIASVVVPPLGLPSATGVSGPDGEQRTNHAGSAAIGGGGGAVGTESPGGFGRVGGDGGDGGDGGTGGGRTPSHPIAFTGGPGGPGVELIDVAAMIQRWTPREQRTTAGRLP